MRTDRELGEKIKKLRLAQKMRLKDVSAKANLSIGYISLIERGACSVSLDSLERIAAALNVPMQYLLHEPERTPQFIFGAEQLETVSIPQTPVFFQFMGNTGDGYVLRPRIVSILPGYESYGFHVPADDESFIYILEGQLEAHIDQEETLLNPGDSIHFLSEKEYVFYNRTKWITKFFYTGALAGVRE